MQRKAGKNSAATPLAALVDRLSRAYSVDRPPADPLRLVMWENIGYLIEDTRREKLLEEFQARVGLDADGIARAPATLLLDIAARGGMRPEMRVARWRQIAAIVRDECGGDLHGRLQAMPPAKARTLLKRFPSIGDPGADRILLFCGYDARPAVDSNGLRVLVRLGALAAGSSYAATYRSAIALLAATYGQDRERLIHAYLLLREHGRELCKRSAPLCMPCPLDALCAHAPAKGL